MEVGRANTPNDAPNLRKPSQPEAGGNMEQDIEDSLVKTLRNSDLSSVAMDFGEIGVDKLLSEGYLRDIPVVSTLVALWKTGAVIRDWLFVRKLLTFLRELKDVEPHKRREMIDNLQSDPLFNQKVGEHLILLLDRLDDMAKPALVGRAFRAYCEGRIDGEQLRLMNRAIDRVFVPHLSHLSTFVRRSERPGQIPMNGQVLQSFTDCGLAWVPQGMATTCIRPTGIAAPFLTFVFETSSDH
jgi:hypothetical protein